eukprot:gene9215-10189_t
MTASKKDRMRLDSKEEENIILDNAFKSFVDDMKPFVLSLSDRQDRQRIALWIKKLCGQVSKTISEKKNRNLYAQVLFHMLRKGEIDGPFDEGPKPGPLLTLPAYMSRYLDKPLELGMAAIKEQRNHPNWIRGELPSSDSAFSEIAGGKPDLESSNEWQRRTSPILTVRSSPNRKSEERTTHQYKRDSFSPVENADQRKTPTGTPEQETFTSDTLDDVSLDEDYYAKQQNRWKPSPPPSPVRRRLEARKKIMGIKRRARCVAFLYAYAIDLQAKTKMIEAKFAEERFALQQELDLTVRKVMNRKNKELEEMKSHYRQKLEELEEIVSIKDKKVAKLTRDLNSCMGRNEKEIAELKAILRQNKTDAEHEMERKIHEKVAEFEEEKFLMQKEHRQSIEELLEETTERLKNIENEYMQRVDAANEKNSEMENEMHQLKRSNDIRKNEVDDLSNEKEQLKEKLAASSLEKDGLNSRLKGLERDNSKLIEDYDKTLRELRRKTDATIEKMKKEHSESAHKAAEVISDFETKMSYFKQTLQDSDLQRKRELRELESTHKQEMIRVELNNDKTVRNLKADMERQEAGLESKIRGMDETMREKTNKIKQLEDQLNEQKRQAQIAIEDFKIQAEENSRKTFQEMEGQIEKIESDLRRSDHERDLQNAKFKADAEAMKAGYEKQLADLQATHEEERMRLLKDAETELSLRVKDYESQQESLKSNFRQAMKQSDDSYKAQREIDSKKILELEQNVRDLREEIIYVANISRSGAACLLMTPPFPLSLQVIQANSLRKQQLVELGMLREEEKQNYQRQEESLTASYRSQIEQQRLDLQKQHSGEMEQILERTNSKLKEIEREYSLSSEKSQHIILQLQNQVTQLTDNVSREQSEAQMRITEIAEKHESEKSDLRRHHNNAIKAMNQDIDLHRSKSKQFEKKFHEAQIKSEESISRLRLEYEEKIRGLLPNSARNELEDTIQALRDQISVIQLRAMTLQEELEDRDELRFPIDQNQSN